MKTVQQKLATRLAQLEGVSVQHRVEPYRRTDSAAGLLSAVRQKHTDAIRRMKRVIELIGDEQNVTESWVVVTRTRCWKGGKYRVYSAAGRDICYVVPKYCTGGVFDVRASGDAIAALQAETPAGTRIFRV